MGVITDYFLVLKMGSQLRDNWYPCVPYHDSGSPYTTLHYCIDGEQRSQGSTQQKEKTSHWVQKQPQIITNHNHTACSRQWVYKQNFFNTYKRLEGNHFDNLGCNQLVMLADYRERSMWLTRNLIKALLISVYQVLCLNNLNLEFEATFLYNESLDYFLSSLQICPLYVITLLLMLLCACCC